MSSRLKNLFSALSGIPRTGFESAGKRHNDDPALRTAAAKSKVVMVFMFTLVWAVCTVSLIFPVINRMGMSLVVGQQAPQTIFAREEFSYEDTAATAALRREAVEKEPVCFTVSTQDNEVIIKRLGELTEELHSLREGSPLPPWLPADTDAETLAELKLIAGAPEIMAAFRESLEQVLSTGVISDAERGNYNLSQLVRILDADLRDRAPKPVEEVPTVRKASEQAAKELLSQFPIGSDDNRLPTATAAVAAAAIGERGNLTYDEARTELRRGAAADQVKPVLREVLKGDTLVIRGDEVTPEIKDSFAAYQKFLSDASVSTVAVQRLWYDGFWCLLLLLFTAGGVKLTDPDRAATNRTVVQCGVLVLASVGFIYLALRVFIFCSGMFNIQPYFVDDVVPVALVSAVAAPLFGMPVALFAGLFISCIATLMLNLDPDMFFRTLLAFSSCSLATAFAVRKVTNYRRYAIRIMAAVTISLFVLGMCNDAFAGLSPERVWMTAVLDLINGFATALAALVLVFFFELVFHVTTNMSLLLQYDINHPLLKELQLRAPGTFYHCQSVAALAEEAAKSIGANYLKCRVGAMFHDIGKLKRPEYFTENNINTANMHEDLTPAMSAIILRSHVEDGVELARQYRLSHLIRNMIQQHHGTSLMKFFYTKAMKSGVTVVESQFRYPGPLPREKEVVIVSLADACEAACRSLTHPTGQNIEEMVNSIFRDRLESGQLDDSELKVSELAKVKESFVRTLTTMNHSRIAYPGDPKEKKE